ncbi:MAG: hypothetical protein U0T83_02240 [Bacteriovoracaceae bacterium]
MGLPYLLFFYGWLRIEIALPLIGLFLFGIIKIVSSIKQHDLEDELTESNDLLLYQFLIFAVVLGLWLYLAGIGGFFFQNGDYVKHNGMFYDLAQLSWPVKYLSQDGNVEIPLVYYIGYHLPCAFVIYLFGIDIGELFIFIWTYLGILLGFLLFINTLKRINIFFVFLFIFFSGLDIAGLYLISARLPGSGEHIEWWAKIWQYPANTTSLFWVPQHFIPALILASLIFKYFYHKRKITHLCAISVLGSLWSPFVTIGISPFILIALLKIVKKNIGNLITGVNFIFAIVLVMLLIYLSSGWYKHPSGFIINLTKIDFEILLLYGLFLGLEVLIYLLFIGDELFKAKRELLWLLLLILMVLPSYKFGYYNDLVMRASLPSLILLQVFIFRALDFKSKLRSIRTVILLVLMIIGSATGLVEFQRGVNLSQYRVGYASILDMAPHFTVQYLGKNNWFWYNVAKKNNTVYKKLPNELTHFLNKLGYFN